MAQNNDNNKLIAEELHQAIEEHKLFMQIMEQMVNKLSPYQLKNQLLEEKFPENSDETLNPEQQ